MTKGEKILMKSVLAFWDTALVVITLYNFGYILKIEEKEFFGLYYFAILLVAIPLIKLIFYINRNNRREEVVG